MTQVKETAYIGTFAPLSPEVYEAAEHLLATAEQEAVHIWTVSQNGSTYYSGRCAVALEGGAFIQVVAGWNSEGLHQGCDKHMPAGRAGLACLSYMFFRAGIELNEPAPWLRRSEALELLAASIAGRE